MNVFPGELGSENVCVKINLVAHDDTSVSAYTGKSGLNFRVLLDVTPPEYPYFISGGQAVSIARDLVDRIKKLMADMEPSPFISLVLYRLA